MKTLKILFILLAGIFLAGCNKDNDDPTTSKPKNYNEITRQHIVNVESQMSENRIIATNSGGVLWQAGDVYVFKTSEGRYGKFQVMSITQSDNYRLLITTHVYNADGSIFSFNTGLAIRGTWFCDLDLVTECSATTAADFFWERMTAADTQLSPKNNAKFVKYTF